MTTAIWRIIFYTASALNTLRSLHNSSCHTKAKSNNCNCLLVPPSALYWIIKVFLCDAGCSYLVLEKFFFCVDNSLILCFLQELENSLNEFGMPWTLNPGDGAFYGPKVIISVPSKVKSYMASRNLSIMECLTVNGIQLLQESRLFVAQACFDPSRSP